VSKPFEPAELVKVVRRLAGAPSEGQTGQAATASGS
jgi:hypothetical protein